LKIFILGCHFFYENVTKKKEINESYFLALFTSQVSFAPKAVKNKSADFCSVCCFIFVVRFEW